MDGGRCSFCEQMVTLIFLGALLQTSDAKNYELKIGVNGTASTSTLTNITVARNMLGERISLNCISDSCLVDARLEWLNGRTPLWDRELAANMELERDENTLTLHIHNFSVENYGRYSCRCVKDFSHSNFLSQGKHVVFGDLSAIDFTNPFCSDQENVLTLLPDERSVITEYFVDTSGQSQVLSCVSGRWVVWNAHSLPQHNVTDQQNMTITIERSADQSKVMCLDSNGMLDRIFYISIRDYQQLRFEFLRPLSDDGYIVVNPNKKPNRPFPRWPVLCVLQQNTVSEVTLYINGSAYRRFSTFIVSSNPQFGSEYLNWIHLRTFQDVGSELYYLGQNFSCVATSAWEPDVTVNFRVIKPDDVAAESFPTLPNTMCSTSPSSLVESPSHSSSSGPLHTPLLPTISATPLPSPSPSLQPVSSAISSSSEYLTRMPSLSTTGSLLTPTFQPASSAVPRSSRDFTQMISLSATGFSLTQTVPLSTETQTTQSNTKESVNIVIFSIVGVVSVLVVITMILLTTFICFKKYCGSAYRSNLSGLTTKELFLEFGMALPAEMQSMDEEELSGVSPTSHPSRQLASCLRELEENQWLFPYELLEIGEDLGSGAFGIVKKARARHARTDGSSMVVAVKMLKDSASDEDEKDLISELKVLQHVGAHPNIASFLGAAIHQGNLHIIVEFCGKGSLLHYLRSKRSDTHDPLTPKFLLAMAHQVAQGMEHLASKKCIHRDLAARNVLVTEDLILKVADFGLARKVYDSIYRPSGGRVPIKWMSLETILDREYTTQSDVWSFGILLWEIMTLGRSPYPGKSPEEVIKCIGRGYRMPPPDTTSCNCPDQVYSLMVVCWDQVPSERPSFSELCTITENMGRDLDALEIQNCLHLGNSETTLSVQTFGTSELCCYCADEVGGAKYCQCSLSRGCEGGESCGYINTHDHTEVDGGGETAQEFGGPAAESRDYVQTRLEIGGPTINFPAEMPNYSNLSLSVAIPTLSSSGHSSLISQHQSSSVPYLPLLWASTDYLPLRQTQQVHPGGGVPLPSSSSSVVASFHTDSHDSKSLCSVRKCSCQTLLDDGSSQQQQQQQHQTYQPKSLHIPNSASLESVCTQCRCEIVSLVSAGSKQLESSNEDWISSRVVPSSLPLRPIPCQDFPPIEKTKVQQQQSNLSSDSGVTTMGSETMDLWSQKSSVSEAIEVMSDLEELESTPGCSEDTFHCEVADRSGISQRHGVDGRLSISSTHNRQVSAHPRFREFFEKLGFIESDRMDNALCHHRQF